MSSINTTSLSLVDIDFDDNKNSLKTFLRNQSVFKDYDFEGSNMSVLLDVLTYNTQKNIFYLNMVSAEAFMDSARLRDSVVSHAKHLNYLPASAKSSKATISVSFSADITGGTFEIPKGTAFSGTNSNSDFSFVTDRNYFAPSASGIYTFNSVDIYEGFYVNESYVVDNSIRNQRFYISNKEVDTDSITVTVIESNGSVVTPFIRADELYGLGPASVIFFLQASTKGRYEIVFGDGVFGRSPKNLSTILISYRVTKGSIGGGVKNFAINSNLGAFNGTANSTVLYVNTIVPGDAGADTEDIETIRFRAPKSFSAQNRAISFDDYKILILQNFPEVKAVHVYVPENQYGIVAISPITFAGTPLSNSRKQDIDAYLQNKKSLVLNTVYIDPDILYIIPTLDIVYDDTITNYSPDDISNLALNVVKDYNDTYLKDFNITFRYSQLATNLQTMDDSIVSNIVSLKLKKNIVTALGSKASIAIRFNNALVPGSIVSSKFQLSDGNAYVLTDLKTPDDTLDTIQSSVIYLKLVDPVQKLFTKIGTVDYTTGKISIGQINVLSYLNKPGIVVTASAAVLDIDAQQNTVLEFDLTSTSITSETQ
jgi:hypothetical protein